MLTQMLIELTRWTKYQKQITARLVVPNKKVTTCYSKPIIKVCLQHQFPLLEEKTPIDSPKPQPVQKRKKKKVAKEQSREPSLEVIIKKQFINEH